MLKGLVFAYFIIYQGLFPFLASASVSSSYEASSFDLGSFDGDDFLFLATNKTVSQEEKNDHDVDSLSRGMDNLTIHPNTIKFSSVVDGLSTCPTAKVGKEDFAQKENARNLREKTASDILELLNIEGEMRYECLDRLACLSENTLTNMHLRMQNNPSIVSSKELKIIITSINLFPSLSNVILEDGQINIAGVKERIKGLHKNASSRVLQQLFETEFFTDDIDSLEPVLLMAMKMEEIAIENPSLCLYKLVTKYYLLRENSGKLLAQAQGYSPHLYQNLPLFLCASSKSLEDCLPRLNQAISNEAVRQYQIQIPQNENEFGPQPCSMDEFVIIKELGSGGYGTVSLAKHKGNQKYYAIKKTLAETVLLCPECITNEERLMSTVNSPFVAKAYCAFKDGEFAHNLVMEFLPGGDLLGQVGQMEVPQIYKVTQQILQGLKDIHEAGYVHMDLKPENIMFDGMGNVKIIDFGLSEPINEKAELFHKQFKGQIGTEYYMSPEALAGLEFGPASDIYSVAVITYVMYTGKLPYRFSISAKEIKAFGENLKSGAVKIPDTNNEELNKLISTLGTIDPVQRYNNF